MHRVFQAFIDGLAASSDADSLRTVLAEAGGALDLSCFAYLALPSRRGDAPELISTYPVEWTDHYLRQSYERLDPVVVGALVDLVPAQVEGSLAVSAFGAFLVAQQAVRRMLPRGHGAVLLTGASASVKGFAQSAPFAMGKFALRGLAQSMARELHLPCPCAAQLPQHVEIVLRDGIWVEHRFGFVGWHCAPRISDRTVDHEVSDVNALGRELAFPEM
jgi:hypothetical protein